MFSKTSQNSLRNTRSSHPEVFATLLKKTPIHVLSCEICKLFKNNMHEKNEIARQTVSSLVLLMLTFDSYWWIGPISSILYQMSTLGVAIIQHKQGIQLCYGSYYDTVTIYNSNIFGSSIDVLLLHEATLTERDFFI